jgi:hypothetical protein
MMDWNAIASLPGDQSHQSGVSSGPVRSTAFVPSGFATWMLINSGFSCSRRRKPSLVPSRENVAVKSSVTPARIVLVASVSGFHVWRFPSVE